MDTTESTEGSHLRSSEVQPSSGGPESTSEQFPSSDGGPRTALAAATSAAAAAASAASAATAASTAKAAALCAKSRAPYSGFTEPSSDSLQPSPPRKIGHGGLCLEPLYISYVARDPYTTTESSTPGPGLCSSSGAGHPSALGSSSSPSHPLALGSSSSPGHPSALGSSSSPGHTSVPGSSSGPSHPSALGSSSSPGHTSVPGSRPGPGHGSAPGSSSGQGHVCITTSDLDPDSGSGLGPSHGLGSVPGSRSGQSSGPTSQPGPASGTSPKFRSLGTDMTPDYASPGDQCPWEVEKPRQWEFLQVSEPGSRGPWKPSQAARKPWVSKEVPPRGQCLLHNWEEERATNHLDQVPSLHDGSESFFFRHGHLGLLTLHPQSPMSSSTTHKDSFPPPANLHQPLRGKREAMVELLLRQQIWQEVQAEQQPTKKLYEVQSVTHQDYRMELVRAGPPAPTKPHDYRKEQPETFWKQRAPQVTGVSNIRTLDTPFRKNCSFSTPVPLSLGQPLPYEDESHPYRPGVVSSLACQGAGRTAPI